MSTGIPRDPVCDNQTTAIMTQPPPVVQTQAFVGDPRCRVITPSTADQTATPPPP